MNCNINYSKLIMTAIQNDEVVNLLRGDVGYEVPISQFESDVFPTDINEILVSCFYEQKGIIENIEVIFKEALEKLIFGCASDVYIALLYFDTCIFQEEINRATFLIEKEEIAKKLKQSINSNKEKLQDQVEFANGSVKLNPLIYIERWNERYVKKYGFSII